MLRRLLLTACYYELPLKLQVIKTATIILGCIGKTTDSGLIAIDITQCKKNTANGHYTYHQAMFRKILGQAQI